MKIFTLVAGYVAWLAVAMKYRKDHGKSKLDGTMPKSKLDSFIDEIVDIHRTAFSDIKWLAKENFDDIENFDDLKLRISGVVSGFSESLESNIENAKKSGIVKKDELLKVTQAFYSKNELLLEKAKAKAISFTGMSEATIDSWLENAHKEIKSAYQSIESRFSGNDFDENPTDTSVSKKDSK